MSQIALSSAARTATVNSSGIDSKSEDGCHVVLDVTAIVTAPSIVLKVQGYDMASSTWYDILTGAAVTTVSTVVYRVHPSLTASANLTVKDMLPSDIRINVAHGNANSITYSVGVTLG